MGHARPFDACEKEFHGTNIPENKKNRKNRSPGKLLKYVRLFLELSVALLADVGLCTFNFNFVKALDVLSLADRACSLSLVGKLSDTCSSMCFRHVSFSLRI